VVVAGGSGSRFGGRKQYAELLGRPVVAWSVAAAQAVADGVVLVVPADEVDGPAAERRGWPQVAAVVPGGASRSASVRAGLAAVPKEAAVVVVHDAVRPLASAGLFRRVVAGLVHADQAAGVVPVVAVVDTLKELDGAWVRATVDRQRLGAVQTPQAFQADALRRAHRAGGDATDDAGLVEQAGGMVGVVEGERTNLKVTTPEDLVVAAALLQAGLVPGVARAVGEPALERPGAAAGWR
jgi:2-C-methyl-D-erythritol 4-phosphate cytidylyltransferase